MQTDVEYSGVSILPIPIVLDLILLSAPLYVNSLITKRGIDVDALSPKAAAWAMFGLVCMA